MVGRLTRTHRPILGRYDCGTKLWEAGGEVEQGEQEQQVMSETLIRNVW